MKHKVIYNVDPNDTNLGKTYLTIAVAGFGERNLPNFRALQAELQASFPEANEDAVMFTTDLNFPYLRKFGATCIAYWHGYAKYDEKLYPDFLHESH